MKSQNRWMKGQTAAIGVSGQAFVELQFLESPAVNFHGLRVDINIEPEAQEANANGYWIVYMFPGDVITTGDLPTSFSQLDDEDIQGYVWGIGAWMASNNTPYMHTFAPKTTRNIPRRGRIVVQVRVVGILPVLTNARINTIITGFT